MSVFLQLVKNPNQRILGRNQTVTTARNSSRDGTKPPNVNDKRVRPKIPRNHLVIVTRISQPIAARIPRLPSRQMVPKFKMVVQQMVYRRHKNQQRMVRKLAVQRITVRRLKKINQQRVVTSGVTTMDIARQNDGTFARHQRVTEAPYLELAP